MSFVKKAGGRVAYMFSGSQAEAQPGNPAERPTMPAGYPYLAIIVEAEPPMQAFPGGLAIRGTGSEKKRNCSLGE